MTLGFKMKATGEAGEFALVRPAKKPKTKKEKSGEKKTHQGQ